MFNRWNVEIRHGLHCDYSYGRNGTDKLTGRIQSVDMRSSFARAYGAQVKLTDGITIGADSITRTWRLSRLAVKGLLLCRRGNRMNINITVRIDRETDSPVLFFWNSNSYGWNWLECYAHIGQHSQCSIEYMRKCKPIKTLDAEALALVREWENLGPADERVNARIVQRLTRSMGHTC